MTRARFWIRARAKTGGTATDKDNYAGHSNSRWRMYRLYVPVGQEQVALDALRVDPSVEAASLNGIVRVR